MRSLVIVDTMKTPILDLSDFFNSKYPDVPFDKLKMLSIGHYIIQEAALQVFKTSSKNARNTIRRTLKRNTGNIRTYITNKTYLEPEFSTKIENIYKSLKKSAIDVQNVATVSCSLKSTSLSLLCRTMNMKNNYKNRYKLQKYVRLNLDIFQQKLNTILPNGTSTPKTIIRESLVFDFSPIENCNFTFSSINTPSPDTRVHNTAISNKREKVKRNLNLLLSSCINDISTESNKNTVDVSIDEEHLPECILKLDKEKTTVSGKVLPHNSKNTRSSTWRRPSYAECKYLEGHFWVTAEEFQTICDGITLKSGRYQYVIKEKVKHTNNTCVINFKHYRYASQVNSFKIYAYCAHNCKKFVIVLQKFVSENNSHRGDVYSSSLNFNHVGKLTRYIKGDERALLRNKLKFYKPSAMRRINVLDASPKTLTRGNLQCIKSDAVYRKVRSEKLRLNDRDSDDVYDMCLMRRKNKSFIHIVGEPLHVYIYSKEQLDICRIECSLTLHLDATGSVVRKALESDKRVFYYAGVIKTTKNKRICPIIEMISCMHDAVSIGNWLANFKLYCLQQSNRWPIVSQVVVDFSFAFINAISIFWNNMPLKVYLQQTFLVLTSKTCLKNDIVKIHICCSHFFKVMANDVRKFYVNSEIKRIIKEILAAAFIINDFNSMKTWFKHFSIILTTPSFDNHVKDALHALVEHCCKLELEQTGNTDSEADKPIDPINVDPSEERLYLSSPFYKFFIEYYKTTKVIGYDAVNKIDNTNDYYNPEFFEILCRKYISILPLWSGLLLPINEKTASTDRLSNATVENWFGYVKHKLLEGKRNDKCSRVIRILRKEVLTIHKEVSLDISSARCTKRKKLREKYVKHDGLQVCEQWRKRSNVPTNFERSNLKKCF